MKALQASLVPRSDSTGSSPFLPALAPWLELDRDSQRWREAEVTLAEWQEFAEAISIIFDEFKGLDQPLALAGPCGIRLVGLILDSFTGVLPAHLVGKYRFICEGFRDVIHSQIARQSLPQGSFHSLLPTEVLKIIIGFAYDPQPFKRDPTEDEEPVFCKPSKLDLALVHPVWRDIALPILWRSITVDLNHDAEVQFFAQVARGTSYATRSLHNHYASTSGHTISVDQLTDLTLRSVTLSNPFAVWTIPFHLRSLNVTIGTGSEHPLDVLLTAITRGSSTTLERLTLDSPTAVQKHLPSFARNLVELELITYAKRSDEYLSRLDPSTLDLRALRKLTLPHSELYTLLATPPADGRIDAPRSTISQSIPHLEHLAFFWASKKVVPADLVNLDHLLRLPLCATLQTLALEQAELDEEMTEAELETGDPRRLVTIFDSASESLRDGIKAVQRSLVPRSDSPGSSPFLPAFAPCLEWHREGKTWAEARVSLDQWQEFAGRIESILGEFKDSDTPLALAGPYGIWLIGIIASLPSVLKGARQTLEPGSFHSLLPTEILKIIIGFAYSHKTLYENDYEEEFEGYQPSKVDLALVHPVWRDVALPLLWHSISVDLNHDAEVKYFAKVARGTSYVTRSLHNRIMSTPGKAVSVDRAIMAVKGLRELNLTGAAMSMRVLVNQLTDLTLHLVELSDPVAPFTIPFRLRSLKITNGNLSENLLDALLTALTPGSSTTLERLSLDSPKAAQKHLPSFSRNLVELSLNDISKLDPTRLDFPRLRKLTLPRSELPTLLATPPADALVDAPRSTISEATPQLKHLTFIYAWKRLVPEDLVNLDRLLRLPLCATLQTLALEQAEFDELMTPSELEVFSKMGIVCRGRGVAIKVDGERLY
ncbi:hypothetical protein RQP46_006294 [Phenoliferia psychrophenolica]